MTPQTEPTPHGSGGIADVLPLGPLQEGLLFHHALAEGTTDAYGIQLRVELLGSADPGRLRRAAAALLRRHPNLRAGFLYEELDRPVQFVPADTDLDWAHSDLTAEPDPVGAEERAVEREFGRGFDLGAPPLIRFHALTTAPDRTVLVVTAHHVLLDGWSLPILTRDLLHLYEVDGNTEALPEAPRYRDHLTWLNGRDQEAARKAWATALGGLAEPTLLAPTTADRAPDASGSVHAPTGIETSLGAAGSHRLRTLAADTGVTTNTVLQAVWALTLSVHTGRDDVVFGQPVSGRPPQLPAAQDAVGLFTNTLPVRVALDPAEPVADLLTRLRLEQADVLDHQWTGLADIQRAAGHGTLFDTLLVVENYPLDEAGTKTGGVGPRAGRVDVRDATHYPVTLTVLPDDGPERDTLLRLDHVPASIPATDARSLLDLFTHLLGQACDTPGRTVHALDPLTPEQRRRVAEHNDTAHPTRHDTVNALLAEAERAHPDHPAVITEDGALTYRELHADAARLARLLIEHGAGAESTVAVALPRGSALVTAVFAVLRCGGVLLPLDLDHPPARLADMTERAGAIAVLTSSLWRDALADLPEEVVRVELDEPATAARVADLDPLPWARPHPEQLAYTLFTSGSTGRPKGVGVAHRAIANRVEWTQDAYRLTPGDRVALKTPVGFDVSVWEFLWPLATGAAIVTVRPDGHRDPAHLRELFEQRGVTVCHFVPAMLRLFVDDLTSTFGSPSTTPAPLPTLRLVIASGEALTRELAASFATALPHTRLENLYGPTEAAIDVTSHPAASPNHAESTGPTSSGTVPIGHPVHNTTLHVLDHMLRPVPPGVTGELYLGGVQLARGYVGRPDLTAGRFVADPTGRAGARLYRTGDLVRRSSDGALVYLGRSDDQVKINGVRVEPGEAETVLRALPGVADAVVSVRTGPTGNTFLAGHVVPGPMASPDPDDLRARLAATLPTALVPATITFLDRLPLSVNGKVDRGALPEPPAAPAATSRRAPSTETEFALCSAIADLLGLTTDEVPVDADFFALGGDSVTSIRLVGRARAAGLEFGVRDVFDRRTPERLAAFAATGTEAPDTPADPGPPPGDEFADLLDAGEMDRLHQLWNPDD